MPWRSRSRSPAPPRFSSGPSPATSGPDGAATPSRGKQPPRERDCLRRGAVTAAADPGRLGPQPCFGHATSMSAAAASVSECADIAHVAAPRLPPSCVPAVAARLPRQAGRSPRSGGGSSPSESGALAAMLDPAGCSSRLVLGRRRESFTVSVRAAVASRGHYLYRRPHRDSRTSRPRALLELVRRWRRPNRTTALVSARREAVVSGTRCSCRRERRSGARVGGMLASDSGLL